MMVGRIPNRSARIPPPAFPNTIASVRNSASQFFAHGKCITLPAKERSTTTKIQQNAMRSDQLPCIGFMENSCFGKFRSSEFRQKISWINNAILKTTIIGAIQFMPFPEIHFPPNTPNAPVATKIPTG